MGDDLCNSKVRENCDDENHGVSADEENEWVEKRVARRLAVVLEDFARLFDYVLLFFRLVLLSEELACEENKEDWGSHKQDQNQQPCQPSDYFIFAIEDLSLCLFNKIAAKSVIKSMQDIWELICSLTDSIWIIELRPNSTQPSSRNRRMNNL